MTAHTISGDGVWLSHRYWRGTGASAGANSSAVASAGAGASAGDGAIAGARYATDNLIYQS